MIHKNNIVLIGFMGTGKTSVSKILSEKLDKNLLETDDLIEKNENKSIKEIFEEKGEDYFRKEESKVLFNLLNINNTVLSCGGGIILKEENINYLRKIGKVFLLVSSEKTIYKRIKEENTRPILNNNMNVEYIYNIMKNREEKYKKAANFTIINENKSLFEVAEEIIKIN